MNLPAHPQPHGMPMPLGQPGHFGPHMMAPPPRLGWHQPGTESGAAGVLAQCARAHRAVMEKPERLRPFIEMGCLTQVTAGSLTGHFGQRALETAVALLEEEWVHAVASDTHNLGGRRPRMREAAVWLGKRYGKEHAHQLTVLGPQAMTYLNDEVNARSALPASGGVLQARAGRG